MTLLYIFRRIAQAVASKAASDALRPGILGKLQGMALTTLADLIVGSEESGFTFDGHVFPAEISTIRNRKGREPRTVSERRVTETLQAADAAWTAVSAAKTLEPHWHLRAARLVALEAAREELRARIVEAKAVRAGKAAEEAVSAAKEAVHAAEVGAIHHWNGSIWEDEPLEVFDARKAAAVPAAEAALEQALRALEEARAVVGDDAAAAAAVPEAAFRSHPPAERPTTAHGLVGLALSGGGIRSSTFNLGVIQGLERVGILRHVDYLSTVSGGGFVGSAWSALTSVCNVPFPFGRDTKQSGEPEAPATQRLRNGANYLVGGGRLDSVRMMMVILRGVFLNFFVMVPYLALMAVVTSIIYGDKMRFAVRHGVGALHVGAFWWTEHLIGAYVLWLIASAAIARSVAYETWNKDGILWAWGYRVYWRRDFLEKTLALGVVVIAVVAFVEAQPLLVVGLHRILLTGHYSQAWAGLGTAATVAGAVLTRVGARASTRLALLLAAIFGPALPISVYLIFSDSIIFDVHSRRLGTTMSPDTVALILWTAGALILILYAQRFVNVNDHSGHSFWRDRLSKAFLFAPEWHDPTGELLHVDSLRLSALSQEGTEFPTEHAAVSTLIFNMMIKASAPYHLFNTTLNLQADQNLANRSRCGDFFVFSKHFIGGVRTGFVPTVVMELIDPHVDVGTAMAISSAAAAPNMGSYTQASVRFLMTIFNVRMGYWVPHPGALARKLQLDPASWPYDTTEWGALAASHVSKWGKLWRASWRASARYLRYEMFGIMDDKRSLVNVSDGGHLENLGVYELLRRRCRYIIVGDGEADGDMQFGSLSALIRFARLDLGIDIEISLANLHLTAMKSRRQHCAVGVIHYPAAEGCGPEKGTLLYLKASLTEDEDTVIAQYRAAKPAFPHESTADQFFDEAQFEAYRSLGVHSVISSFELTKGDGTPDHDPAELLSFASLEALFKKLPAALSEIRSRPKRDAPPPVITPRA